jgi:hypothetical protein
MFHSNSTTQIISLDKVLMLVIVSIHSRLKKALLKVQSDPCPFLGLLLSISRGLE